MNIIEKCQVLPIIHTQKVEWSKGGIKNNIITPSYPVYNDDVKTWIDTFNSLDLADTDYIANSEKIQQKAISELTRDETLTRITSIVRGERLCDGRIAKALNDN